MTEQELLAHIDMLRDWAKQFPVGDYARQINLLADAYADDLRVLVQAYHRSTIDYILGV